MDATSPPPTASHRASGSSFYTAMRILPARAARRHVRDLSASAARSTTSPIPAGRGRSRIAQLGEWRDEINDLYRGQDRRRRSPASPSPCANSASSARISSPSSTAWRWTRARTSARRASPRSISIATGWRARSGGSRSACSASTEDDGKLLSHHLGRALQLTNILRDLDEDAGIGRLYLPREALDQAGIDDQRSHDRAAQPESRARPARRWSSARAPISSRPTAIMQRCPRRTVKAPRIMGEVYRVDPGRHGRARLERAARTRQRVTRPARLDHPAIRVHLMARTVHIIGAGLAGLSAAVELALRGETVVVHEATDVRRRPLPLLSRLHARHDHRQRQPSGVVGQSRRAALSAAPGRARTAWSARRRPNFRSSISPPASNGRCGSTTAAFRGGSSIRASACRAPAPSTISRSRACCGRRTRSRGRRGRALHRAALRAADAAAAAGGAQHRAVGGLGGARRRRDPRDARRRRTGLPSADRARRPRQRADRARARVPARAQQRRCGSGISSSPARLRNAGRSARFRQRQHHARQTTTW